MMATIYVYGMRCPVNDEIMYVGASVDIEVRKNQHLHEALSGGKSTKCSWLRHLVNDGWRPTMEVIEECTENNWREREMYWIETYRMLNPHLTNSHDTPRVREEGEESPDEERLEIRLTKEQKRRLKELAAANSLGAATVLRLLIDRAYVTPRKFGFEPPKKEGDK